jgi:glycerophosphoryl diester phosphodiesterase
MPGLEWLVARPVAHRGLHDGSATIENTPSAFVAAIKAGYGIECDLQVSADGEAMVFHDAMLGRLTEANARVDSMRASDLKRLHFKTTKDHMITLGELCDLTAGAAPLLIEMKSHFPGDCRLLERCASVISSYQGAASLMSFDPRLVRALRTHAPALTRGIVAEKKQTEPAAGPSCAPIGLAARCYEWARARPQFIAFSANDLPDPITSIARKVFGLRVLAWTVRMPAQQRVAMHHADQIIFEGFRPCHSC